MDCPRCESTGAATFFEAPKNGAWELYRCPNCFFIWRSTEKETIKNKDLYHPAFKLNEDKIKEMIDKPAIPPLLKVPKVS